MDFGGRRELWLEREDTHDPAIGRAAERGQILGFVA